MQQRRVAFIGAGSIAAYHAYALSALPFYYADAPRVELAYVASSTAAARDAFAARYGFGEALPLDALAQRADFDSVYILSPNARHFEQLRLAASLPNVARIYVEKPLCVTEDEERALGAYSGAARVQAGFQFLQNSAVRRAVRLWRDGGFGTPVHFQARYLHSGYLDRDYRARRAERMKPAPEGGAMVDLGSHAFSLAVALFGDGLRVVEASASGAFHDVQSDLCTIALCRDAASGAVGTVMASRVSAGAGELLDLELRGTSGGFRLSTEDAESLEVFSASSGKSELLRTASDYAPHTEFPKRAPLGGWLRALVHANYLFLTDRDDEPRADLHHALTVQRLLRETTRRIT